MFNLLHGHIYGQIAVLLGAAISAAFLVLTLIFQHVDFELLGYTAFTILILAAIYNNMDN